MDNRELWTINGELLLQLRRARGWSRAALAQAAELSPHTVAKAERGGAIFPENARRISDALGIPLEMLRATARSADLRSRAERELISLALEQLELYYHGAMEQNLELLKSDFLKPMAPQVVVSFVPAAPVSYEGIYRGHHAVTEFLEASLAATRRKLPFSIESVSCLDARHVAIVASDQFEVVDLNVKAIISTVLLFTFDGKPGHKRLIALRESDDTMRFEPLPAPPASRPR